MATCATVSSCGYVCHCEPMWLRVPLSPCGYVYHCEPMWLRVPLLAHVATCATVSPCGYVCHCEPMWLRVPLLAHVATCATVNPCGYVCHCEPMWLLIPIIHVPDRKIGERCSPSNEDGACIAPNSLCDMDTGKCVCHSNFREAWGGEACVADLQPGETCDPSPAGSSDLQKCSGGSLCPNTDFESRYKRWGEGLSAAPPTCACQDDMRLSLMFAHPGYSYWLQPMCVQGEDSYETYLYISCYEICRGGDFLSCLGGRLPVE